MVERAHWIPSSGTGTSALALGLALAGGAGLAGWLAARSLVQWIESASSAPALEDALLLGLLAPLCAVLLAGAWSCTLAAWDGRPYPLLRRATLVPLGGGALTVAGGVAAQGLWAGHWIAGLVVVQALAWLGLAWWLAPRR